MVSQQHALKYLFLGSVISSGIWIIGISLYLHGENRFRMEVDTQQPHILDEKNDVGNHANLGIIKNNEDLKKRDDGYSKFSFNLLVSDRIGLKRDIPDARHKSCPSSYEKVNGLPRASVVICFHNEAWSTLMRTVHSVIERTPASLLQEIILFDDFSSPSLKHANLPSYLRQNLPKVKLYEADKRQGLIRGRLTAAKKASGEVLVFLDSHCEVNKNWLPPLLSRISADKTRVVCPMIDIISSDTFAYSASPLVRGGFNWGLHFSWEQLTEEEMKSSKDPKKPIRSPTMAGGLFAINRKYFFHLGGYDEGMDIWGGENLEISFRIWMCGGTLEIIPCSRVGHVFREQRPYGNAGRGDTMSQNSLRVAEVWLDKYKTHFYNVRTDLRGSSYGDISDRVALRKQLKCKSFKWYLDNIYPELAIPLERPGAVFRVDWVKRKKAKTLLQGNVRNLGSGLCLDSSGSKYDKKMNLVTQTCSPRLLNIKLWLYNVRKEMKAEGILCMDVLVSKKTKKPKTMKCHGELAGQEWQFSQVSKRLYNPATGMCLSADKKHNFLSLEICDGTQYQQWEFE